MIKRALVILLLWTVVLPAGDRWQFKTGFESGLYTGPVSDRQFQTAMSAHVQYAADIRTTAVRFKSRIAPRYFLDDQLTSVKFSTTLDITRSFKIGTFNVQGYFRNNRFGGDRIPMVSYHLIQAQMAYARQIGKKAALQVHGELYRRDFTSGDFNTMTAVITRLSLVSDRPGRVGFGMGVFREDYSIYADITTPSGAENSGVRFGPEFSLRLKSDYIATVFFSYGFNNTDLSSAPNQDYRIVLLAGTYITRGLSVFLYAHYYKGSASDTIPIQLTYKPVTDENYYYVKLGYDVMSAIEFYLKCGYQREELYVSGNELSGTQVLAGISGTF